MNRPPSDAASASAAFDSGLELIRAGRYFDAHEELELAWRAAAPGERDFFQGVVHLAVAWYQAGRGRLRATRARSSRGRGSARP